MVPSPLRLSLFLSCCQTCQNLASRRSCRLRLTQASQDSFTSIWSWHTLHVSAVWSSTSFAAIIDTFPSYVHLPHVPHAPPSSHARVFGLRLWYILFLDTTPHLRC